MKTKTKNKAMPNNTTNFLNNALKSLKIHLISSQDKLRQRKEKENRKKTIPKSKKLTTRIVRRLVFFVNKFSFMCLQPNFRNSSKWEGNVPIANFTPIISSYVSFVSGKDVKVVKKNLCFNTHQKSMQEIQCTLRQT